MNKYTWMLPIRYVDRLHKRRIFGRACFAPQMPFIATKRQRNERLSLLIGRTITKHICRKDIKIENKWFLTSLVVLMIFFVGIFFTLDNKIYRQRSIYRALLLYTTKIRTGPILGPFTLRRQTVLTESEGKESRLLTPSKESKSSSERKL